MFLFISNFSPVFPLNTFTQIPALSSLVQKAVLEPVAVQVSS